MEKRNIFSADNLNIALFSLLSILLGLQILIWVAFIFNFIPIKPTIKFLVYRFLVRPEREIFFYRIFVLSVLLFQTLFIFVFRRNLKSAKVTQGLLYFLAVDSVVLFFTFLILFKMVIYNIPPWTKIAFCIILGIGIGVKIFRHFLGRVLSGCIAFPERFTWAMDSAVVMFLALLFYIPDLSGEIAELFSFEKFAHWQAFIISSGIAAAKGCILHVDAFSMYGVGMPIMISQMSKWLGGFNYENILLIFVAMSFLYFLLVYVFLRVWINSIWVALLGVILAVHFQMFGYSAGGHVWYAPGSSVVRYFFDISIFILLWLHLKDFRKRYLLIAAFLVGVALFYIIDSGVYTLMAFYAYLAIFLLFKEFCCRSLSSPRERFYYGAFFFLPVIFAIGFYWLVTGNALFTKSYWLSLTETVRLFMASYGALPIYTGLEEKEFALFFIGCLFPLVYLLHTTVLLTAIFLKKIHERNILAAVLGIYGLCTYQYFVGRSSSAAYLAVSVPFVMVLCFWLDKGLSLFNRAIKERSLLLLIFMSLAILLTSSAYLDYPNMLNINKAKMLQYKKEMKVVREQVLDPDAAFIARFIPANGEAWVFSSVAPQLLMLANRRPGLYFVDIAPATSFLRRWQESFEPFFLYTKEREEILFRKLREKNPEYIFAEKNFVEGESSRYACEHHQILYTLLQYLSQKYCIFERGEDLVVLRRRS